MLATAGAFVGKFHVKKPNLRGILILVALGAAEFLLFLLLRLVTRHG
ncbi:unknown [Firmicutes bacterium CAG:137]|nr:unknown [Firmicutes bacterium CAG:137]